MATPVNPKKSTDIAVIEKPHSVLIFRSEDPAKHPSPPARAAQADFSQSPDKGAASADWSAQSPPPACCRDRIHPQCAPTPPKSAAVRLHQKRDTLLLAGCLFFGGRLDGLLSVLDFSPASPFSAAGRAFSTCFLFSCSLPDSML